MHGLLLGNLERFTKIYLGEMMNHENFFIPLWIVNEYYCIMCVYVYP